MWELDLAFADVVATSTDPNLGAIRLAWWRERLEELDEGKGPLPEPRLQAVATELVTRGVTGLELSKLEDAWLPLLDPSGHSAADGLKLRGRILFGIGARLLGADPLQAEAPGELWSLVDGARHCGDRELTQQLLDAARALPDLPKAVHQLRPLTMVAALAASEMRESAGGIRRGLAAFGHRYRGIFPRG